MSKIPHRDISPLLQRFRAFLLGRELTPALRFQDEVAPRTQPPPNLPKGLTHKIKENYYCSRDVRREVKPPAVIAASKQFLVESGEKLANIPGQKLATPGRIHQWD